MSYKNHIKPIVLALSIVIGVLLCTFTTVIADEHAETTEEAETTSEAETTEEASEGDAPVQLESLVVVGTRARPRSVLDSAVPIDIVSNDAFEKQGGADLPDLLRTLVPSYNVNTQPISDASTVVRPANLRGLAPDHTLVLVNNKRRHRAAVIHWLGNGLSDGSQGPDLAPIPAIALQQVEVLRDGASAQYGSDAIAGVMNFRLKDNYEGGSFEFKPGIYQFGDGRQFALAGNIGLGNPDAWTSLSFEYGGADPTIRSVQRTDAINLIKAGNFRVKDPAQIWGQPIIENDVKLFANYGATLTDTIEFYGHANYARKRVEGGFYFRNPNTRNGVFSPSGKDDTLLVGDLRGLSAEMADWEARRAAAEAAGEEFTELSPHDADDIPIVNHVPDPERLQAVKNDPNLFNFQEMFPGGFTPRFGAFMWDSSVVVGVKGTALKDTLGKDLTWDLSGSFGRNHADFFIFNTVNASLGPDTPTYFDPGDYIQTDYNLNFDVTYPLSDMVFLASGLEYRDEGFQIIEGERESHQIGPLAAQGFTAASNGFSGFSPVAAGKWYRSNVAMYLETEIRPIDPLLIALAVRGEQFEIFGSTLNYKAAANYKVTETMRLRGSYSTGFRAPTPGQQNTFNITTEYDFEQGDLVNKGTIPSTNPAVDVVTGKEDNSLDPEKSNNFTGGFTVDILGVNFTMDFFDIRLKERLSVSQHFALTNAQKAQLIAEGVTSAANLETFQFFTNDFSTTTQGVDAVVTAPIPNGTVVAVYNFTNTTVTDHNPDTLNEDRIRELQENLPAHRASLTGVYSITDAWGVLGRASYFSGWFDSEDYLQNPDVEGTGEYTGRVIFDLETSYTVGAGLTLTLGGRNILNTYPDENPNAAGSVGNKYGQFSPFGFDGAFWYAKVGYSF
ncbi:TonB-dependent receptor [Candidatus Poribacteria bacterium]|nr:TonB-dependent receptor [Candidatus Poribacteria bacterium]MYK97081.1 TonB-dependent receptor [Candidatus Poribacteria bacterium]